MIKKKPSKQIPAYTQKVPAAPNDLFRSGNVNVRIKQAIHSEKVANAIAAPRIRFGKISDKITHTIGANDMAYIPIAITTNDRTAIPLIPRKNAVPSKR